MSEKNTILSRLGPRESVATGLPKTNTGQLIRFLSQKLDVASDFVHKWAKP
jgi:hypothetical protein